MIPSHPLYRTFHNLETTETEFEILSKISGGSSLEVLDLEGCRPLLEELLQNPIHMPEAEDRDNEIAATLIWRASIAAGIGTRAVIDNVAITLVERPQLLSPISFDLSQSVASDILNQEPRLLIDATPQQQNSLLTLVGCDPDNVESSPNIMEVFYNNNAVLPEALAENLRECRDNVPITQPPTFELHYEDGVHIEPLPYTERQIEMEEAAYRLVIGSFLADHTLIPEDHDYAKRALSDYVGRAFQDIVGITTTLAFFDDELETIKSKNIILGRALETLEQKLFETIPTINLGLLTQDEVIHLTEAAHGFLSNSKYRDELAPFKSQLHDYLKQFKEFNGTFQDPDLPEESSSPNNLKEMVQVATATRYQLALNKALDLYDNQQVPITDDIGKKLAEGVLQDYNIQLIAAIKHISKELNPTKREDLRQSYDNIIGTRVKQMSPDEKLAFFIQQDSAIRGLALFESGQNFIDYCITHAINEVASEQLPLEKIIKTTNLVANGLWQNILYYTNSNERGEEVMGSINRLLDGLSKGIERHRGQPGAKDILYKVKDSIQGLKDFILTVLLPNPKSRDITSRSLLYQMLEKYRNEIAS